MDAETIADKARNEISEYCYKECNAYCCRKGYLVLDEAQAKLITSNKIEDFEKNNFLKRIKDGKFSLNLGMTCPKLKDLKCTIHKENIRPEACKNFPIFIFGKMVIFSSRCPAVKEGKFYAYEKRFMQLGYNIGRSDPIHDSDMYKIMD
ncbi:YkgJ family cysteine cluster protein [Candidatus Woesearchaeota archaeon]|nr:YkgJ family cysteine cluster protein [Candidatus Woesearchaeota archaeon]